MNDLSHTAASGEPLEALIASAWDDHADAPEAVAERLRGALKRLARPEDVAPLAALLAHVFGEHLGRYGEGLALLERLAYHPAARDQAVAQSQLARQMLALRFARGDTAVAPSLGLDDAVSVRAMAASMLCGRRQFAESLALLDEAVAMAEGSAAQPDGLHEHSPLLREASPALRALAVAGNNLAAALEELAVRDDTLTRGMLRAAEAGLRYWLRAGTWLEAERAEYRLARSCLAAGDATGAVAAAERCLARCIEAQAPDFERVFACAVLASSRRAAGDLAGFESVRAEALRLDAGLPAEDRRWTAADLDLLRD
jgi:hypothetical protein